MVGIISFFIVDIVSVLSRTEEKKKEGREEGKKRGREGRRGWRKGGERRKEGRNIWSKFQSLSVQCKAPFFDEAELGQETGY